MARHSVRQRYWARSLVGWRYFGQADPNPAHLGFTELERAGRIELLVTQNVDDLHQRAGQKRLLALHGGIDRIRCMDCKAFLRRDAFQRDLLALNPGYAHLDADVAPDGDADVQEVDFSDFRVPECEQCGGILKPDAVFYGESVPRERHRRADEALRASDAVLVAGSSLMVYSSFRFARQAAELGKPIAAINLGRTRADDLLSLKIAAPVEDVIPRLTDKLCS